MTAPNVFTFTPAPEGRPERGGLSLRDRVMDLEVFADTVESLDPDDLDPERFMRQPPTPVPDKSAIKTSLKHGLAIKGCALVATKRLERK